MSEATTLIPNDSSIRVSHPEPVQELTDDGAITIPSGVVFLNKAGVVAATLAAPKAPGLRLTIFAVTAQAHTVTVAGGLRGAGAGADVGTFGGAIADGIELISDANYWYDVPGTNTNVTFA